MNSAIAFIRVASRFPQTSWPYLVAQAARVGLLLALLAALGGTMQVGATAAPDGPGGDKTPRLFTKTSSTKAPMVLQPTVALASVTTCSTCDDGGGVKVFTFRYEGPTAFVEAFEDDDNDHPDKRRFSGTLNSGQTLTVTSTRDKFDKLSLWLDGDLDTHLHLSCSQDVSPGSVWGSFTVVAGVTKDGPALCTCSAPQDEYTQLTLTYSGSSALNVRVEDKGGVLFIGAVNPMGEITFSGSKDNDQFDDKVKIYNADTSALLAEFKAKKDGDDVSVGDDVGGGFQITGGRTKKGGEICDTPPPGGASCLECGFGADDANKVSQLTLEYIGAGTGVTLEVYDNADDSPDKLVFSGIVSTGDSFGIVASSIGRTEFSSKIGVWVDGVKVAELHTSCSDAIGPGTTEQTQEKGQDPNGAADIKVVSGQDKDNVALCSIPPPPPGPTCLECGFGSDDANKVSQLTLEYIGAGTGVTLEIYDNADQSPDKLVFSGIVSTGDSFSVFASAVGRNEFSSKIGIWVDGVKVAELHTSCSDAIGPGTTEQTQEKGQDPNGAADVKVLSGQDKDNVALCSIPLPPDCLECKGGVVKLTLSYDGNANDVRIETGNIDYTVANGRIVINSDGDLVLMGTESDGKFDNNNLEVFVNNHAHSEIHVSCSQPIGPGTTFSDGTTTITVVEAISKDNGKVCPVGSTCVQCGFGADDANKVSQLTLEYTGAGTGVTLEVYDNADHSQDKLVFSGIVSTGDSFGIVASTVGRDEFSSKIGIWVDGVKVAELHTSCSDVLRPGTTEQTQVKGQDPNGVVDIKVVSGRDKDSNRLGDGTAPSVQYSFVSAVSDPNLGLDRFVRIDITDDIELGQVDITLADEINANCAADAGCTINLVPAESSVGITCTPDPFSGLCIVNPASVPAFCTVAEDLVSCDFPAGTTSAFFTLRLNNFTQNTLVFTDARDVCGEQCPDQQAPVISFTEPNQTVLIAVSDDQAVESFTTFRLANLNPPTTPVLPQANFTVQLTRIDPTQVASFGALAADACNAFVYDPQTASKRGGAATGETPLSFGLDQNYPNPFNPSTQISYAIPEAGAVRLVVYDVLGREVQVLASGEYAAGQYTVQFDARSLASGTYFYRLDAAGKTQVRQMILMK